jgi:phosphomethylpyrimidine synthase
MPMNAIPKPAADLLQQTEQLSESVTRPIPGSRKIMSHGFAPTCACRCARSRRRDTPKSVFGAEINPPFTVYDTSGPYTDPGRAHRSAPRPAGIARGVDRGARRHRAADRVVLRVRRGAPPIRAWPMCASHAACRAVAQGGANVSQMHYARRGIVTPEMEYIAIRENQKLEAMRDESLLRQHPGESFGASIQKFITPGIRAR